MFHKGHQSTIMGLIDKDIARNYEELAKEFCIPQGTIGNIAYNNRNNSAWHGLNVYTWLQGNTEVYDEGVKANVRWLYDAVRTIDKKLGTKIAKGIFENKLIFSKSDITNTCLFTNFL